ncbi:MAG: type II secretion system GspH family protein [Gammaproteobacteria bacterium]|nr:type II secretion system GspH family protein [Gammaproteobacteria bacterium]MCH9743765.1 type II secretion system GspH family protein [Gammaproteobacteria bacterium]
MKNAENRAKTLGYTLIELLLVIAIISLIAALGILAYRRYFFTQRVEKVSLEMQHVLEAAMAFNVDHQGSWPDANQATPNCIPVSSSNTFVRDYLPQGRRDNATTSFGNHYCWSAVQSGSHEVGTSTQNASRLFWVAVRVPNGDRNLAERIAARLPDTIVTSDPTSTASPAPACAASGGECYVRSEITQPSQVSNQQSGAHVVAIGKCRTDQTGPLQNSGGGSCAQNVTGTGSTNQFRVTFTACPSGQPEIAVMPDYFRSYSATAYSANILSIETTPATCSTQAAQDGTEYCDVGMSIMVCRGRNCASRGDAAAMGGSEGANYIVTCAPATPR